MLEQPHSSIKSEVVQTMTEKELSGLYYLNRETEYLQKELDELEYSTGVKSVVLSHTPKSKRRYGVEDMAAEKADLKAIIQLNLLKIQRERARIERFIGNIKDPETRLIFRLRHINGMKWREIGDEMHMTYETARRKHKAHLKKL